MERNIEIITLDPLQKKRASAVVAAAFFDYPMFTCYFPDSGKRARVLPWYLGNALNCALRYGEVLTTPEISGVIFTLPPGHTKISLGEYIRNGYLFSPLILGSRDYARSQKCEKFVGDTHEKIMDHRPHYYLWGLAVDPNQKRRGIGAALLKPLIEKANADNMPIYLETHDETNVAYYQRTGFSLVHTGKISEFGLSFWCMVRDPNNCVSSQIKTVDTICTHTKHP